MQRWTPLVLPSTAPPTHLMGPLSQSVLHPLSPSHVESYGSLTRLMLSVDMRAVGYIVEGRGMGSFWRGGTGAIRGWATCSCAAGSLEISNNQPISLDTANQLELNRGSYGGRLCKLLSSCQNDQL